ncbi:NAD(P)-binding protein [Bacillus sp. A015]
MKENLPVVIIGGGPVGIAAAAHLIKRNESFLLFESGKQIGKFFRLWTCTFVFTMGV